MCIRFLTCSVVTVNITNRLYTWGQTGIYHQIAPVIEESCPKDLQSYLHIKSARHKLVSVWFSSLLFIYYFVFSFFFLFSFSFLFFHPVFAVFINYGYFSVSQWIKSKHYLTLQAWE